MVEATIDQNKQDRDKCPGLAPGMVMVEATIDQNKQDRDKCPGPAPGMVMVAAAIGGNEFPGCRELGSRRFTLASYGESNRERETPRGKLVASFPQRSL